jgi:hypothetical protein
MPDVGEELTLGAARGEGLLHGLLQRAGAVAHLLFQAQAQPVELVVGPAEAVGEGAAHGDQDRRKTEG